MLSDTDAIRQAPVAAPDPEVHSDGTGHASGAAPVRVHMFVDGFNLYHALQWFEDGVNQADNKRYRKYKWTSLWLLAECYVSPKSQRLVGVTLFTTLATWDPGKHLRHRQFVTAQESQGVEVIYGKFKEKWIKCKGGCGNRFSIRQEKQTDVNIATTIVQMAHEDRYDKAILISGDSDLVPAIELVHRVFPQKEIAVVVPIGRKGDEIEAACKGKRFKMTEDHLKRSKMADKLQHPSGKWVVKPTEYA